MGKGIKKQTGNIFAMLFGAVAMTGVIGVTSMNMILGPATTASKVTHQNMTQNDLLMNAKVVVMNASTRDDMGDEDNDGYVEPVPFIPTSEGSCNITLPAGGSGGCLPHDIGAVLTDPWGSQYMYCVWDHGEANTSANRISGEDSTSGAVLAIISAGPNKRFETLCLPYDGDPATNDIAINPKGEGDDLVQIYTYAAAVAGSGGLWELKEGEPTTATITKDIEVEGAFRMGTAGEDPGQVGESACTQGSHVGRMRFNPFDQAIEVCGYAGGFYEWEMLAAAGSGVPVGTISAFAGPACPSNWQAVTELQGRMIMGAGSGYTVGQTGGAASVALSVEQIPSHHHSVNPPATNTTSSGDHSHIVDPPYAVTSANGAHNHSFEAGAANVTFTVSAGYGTGVSGIPAHANGWGGFNSAHWLSITGVGDHQHSIDIPAFFSASGGAHSHTVDIAAFNSGLAGSGQAHENLPPYRVYLYCMYMGGGGGAAAKSFNDLDDVDTSGAQDKDILVWNQGAGQWLPENQWVKNAGNLHYQSGNVGIGTNSPQTRLHIESGDNEDTVILGKFNIGTATSAVPVEQAQLILSGAFNAGYNGHAVPMAVKLWIGGYDNDGTVVYPIYVEDENNTPDFWIKNKPGPEALSTAYFQGNVGIGTETPSYRLTVTDDGPSARTVYGRATSSTGVTYGGYFQSDSSLGRGVHGVATNTIGSGVGVYGQTNATGGNAVYGVATATSGTTFAIHGQVNSPDGYALRGNATNGGYGLYSNGKAHIQGNLTISGVASAATPTAANHLATKDYVDKLGNRTCANGQILKFQSGAWACAGDNSGGGSDNLGSHIASQNIVLGSHWLNGDSGNEGISVSSTGQVRMLQAGGVSYDVWIQGGAFGAAGEARNLALLGSTSNDMLYVNHASEYTGGTQIGGPIILNGTTTINGAINASVGTIRDSGGGWVRTYGATGWYNQTYGGGWYMADTTWVRSYSNKSVYTGGNMQAAAFLYASDARLKAKIKPLELSLDALKGINAYRYHYKDDEDKTPRTGVLAQEVQAIFPEAVKTGEDGMLSVDYPTLVPVLIDAVNLSNTQAKEMRERIDRLDAANDNLRTEIRALTKELR